MALSIFDLFKVGIGPSSSHTVGPMVAANRFLAWQAEQPRAEAARRLKVTLYGSLALTGRGHATDVAVMLGLLGEQPATVMPSTVADKLAGLRERCVIGSLEFNPERDLVFDFQQRLPEHSNGMRFHLFDGAGIELLTRDYYSVGGGFVMDADEIKASQKAKNDEGLMQQATDEPYSFTSASDLMQQARERNLSIAELMLRNESAHQPREEVERRLLEIWQVMDECIRAGCSATALMPGGLSVKRRAPALYQKLSAHPEAGLRDPLTMLDWVSLYALAVNEENAAGGRVVTAPTNGAAGVVPAVLAFYQRFVHGASERGIIDFLATAAAIGMLYKRNASISAAEVGCQGEIGVACSMAAGALCAVMGGDIGQIENAAEIGMEHNLGLTCDPINGLVQVPCIERNAMGAVKAINAARLAMRGDGVHFVSLDSVIETMRQTGIDMQDKYKETATGGLAVNVVAC